MLTIVWTIVDNCGQLWTMAPIWSLTKGRAEGTRWTDGLRWRQSRVNEGFWLNRPPSSISSPPLSTPSLIFSSPHNKRFAAADVVHLILVEVFSPKRFWIVLNPKLLLVCLAAAALVALVESGSLSKLGVILLCLILAPAADPKRIHYAKYKNKQIITN